MKELSPDADFVPPDEDDSWIETEIDNGLAALNPSDLDYDEDVNSSEEDSDDERVKDDAEPERVVDEVHMVCSLDNISILCDVLF